MSERENREREREREIDVDVGIICVIIYDDLALKAWTQRERKRERENRNDMALHSNHGLEDKKQIDWNFAKYLCDRKGNCEHYTSSVYPLELQNRIEELLREEP